MYEQYDQMPYIASREQNIDAGLMQQGNDELIKWIESPQTRINQFVKELAGKEFNSNTGEYEARGDTIMNEKGERFYKIILRGTISTDTVLSRIDDDDELRRHIEPIMARAIIHSNLYKNDFQMSTSWCNITNQVVGTKMYFVLKKAFGQGERKFLNFRTTHTVQNIAQPNDKGGFLSKFSLKR